MDGTPAPTQVLLSDRLAHAQAALAALRSDETLARAEPLFRDARDAADWRTAAEAALCLARCCGNLRRMPDAIRWAQEAMQAAQQVPDAELECAAWVSLVCDAARLEDARLAQQAVDNVLRLAAALHSPRALEAAYSGLASAYSELGLASQAVQFARRAFESLAPEADPARRSLARTNLLIIGGVACEILNEGDPVAAQALLAELTGHLPPLLQECRQTGSPMALARYHRVAAALHNCAHRWGDALMELQALDEMGLALPPHLASSLWIEIGLAQRRLGRVEAARQAGARAAAHNPVPADATRAVDLRRLALVQELLGNADAALAFYKRYHDRRHHMVSTALESRAASLVARLEEQGLRVENNHLRAQNAGLAARVQQISRLAATDPLTGLDNRREFELRFAQAQALGQPLALLLLDLDHFKQVNDRHSHGVGDAVLRQVAALMQASMRGLDRPARYGGEEFALLLVDIQPDAASASAERLRRRVQAHDWSTLAAGLQVSFSGGLVAPRQDEAFDSAVARADALLYAAKRQGRNRVLADWGAMAVPPAATAIVGVAGDAEEPPRG